MSLIATIEDVSPRFTDIDGTVKYIVPLDVIEKYDAENQLFMELERGKWSLENEPTATADEFSEWLATL